KGDILATTGPSLTLMAGVFGAVALLLMVFRKEFLLVSFDRDMAVIFGEHAGVGGILLYLLLCLTIALGRMTPGQLGYFAFPVIPPFTARMITRRMLPFSLTAACLGALTAFAGFYCAYHFDLPLGPAEVALASLGLAVVTTTRGLWRWLGRWRVA